MRPDAVQEPVEHGPDHGGAGIPEGPALTAVPALEERVPSAAGGAGAAAAQATMRGNAGVGAWARRLWRQRPEHAATATTAIATSTLVALGVNIYTVLATQTTAVSHLFYIPAVLAGYWMRWLGVAYTSVLALAYVLIVTFAGQPGGGAVIGAVARAVVFVSISVVVALLSSTLRSAQRSLSLQKDLALDLNAAESLEDAAERVFDAVLRVAGIDGSVFLIEKDGHLHPFAMRGFGAGFRAWLAEAPDDYHTWLRQTGSRFDTYAAIVQATPLDADPTGLAAEIRGAGTVPVTHERALLGMLLVTSRSEPVLSPSTQTVVESIAAQLGGTLERLNAAARLHRRSKENEALLSSARTLSSTTDYDEVLRRIAQEAALILNSPECAIWEYDEDSDSEFLHSLYQRVPSAEVQRDVVSKRYPLDEYPEDRRLILGNAIVEERVSDPAVPLATREAMMKWGEKSALSVPLHADGKPIGLLVLIETEAERHFDDDDRRLASGIGEQAALAIQNARLYRRIADQAIRDGLTGLYNHRHFREQVAAEVNRARRFRQPVSILMLDIDDFKRTNDTYGHPAGDELVCAISQVLGTQLRRGIDLAARYGGDELALLLPNTGCSAPASGDAAGTPATPTESGPDGAGSPEAGPAARPIHAGALGVAERIRATVGASTYATEATPNGVQVTVSIGVACMEPGEPCTANELIARADEALYTAKRRGKDRVVAYGS